jgi:phosphate ABC transporter phosphate-binding protein
MATSRLRGAGVVLTATLSMAAAVVMGTGATPAGASGPTVTGSGSSWAALALDQWVADVSAPQYGSLNVSYSTTSSVIGLNEFAQNQVNFGVSEIGYSTGQADNVPPSSDTYQYLPAVGGADCLMYNVTGDTGQVSSLNLNSTVLAGIFTGTITSWNSPQIQSLNPSVSLPDTPITVVYRTEAAGDNYVFSDYLETLQPGDWNAYTAKLGTSSGPQAIWPVPQGSGDYSPYNFSSWIGEDGSDNASNYVAGNSGSITYVETGYANEHGIPCANVQNASGAYVQPSESNDAVALEGDQLQPDLEQNLTGVFTDPSASAYPISAYGYFITQEGQTPSAIGNVLGVFLKFVACQGQRQAGQLGYTPLPPNLVQDDFDAIGRINGAPPPGPVDASNCPNPYVTGTLAPTVGPTVVGQASSTPTSAATAGGTTSGAAGTTTAAKAAGTGASTTPGATASGAAAGTSSAAAPGAPARGSGTAASLVGAHGGELASAVTGSGSPLSSADSILWWTVGFILLLGIPTALLVLRRRRRTESGEPA